SGGGGGGIDPAASDPTPSANVQADEQARLIRAALERIPDTTDREMVRLCFFEGLSLRQIAERLNLTYDEVRERYHSSLRLLERAPALERRLAVVEMMYRVAHAAQPAAGAAASQPGPASRERGLHLKCPHCGNCIQLVQPEPQEVVCQSFGSSFHVEPGATTD